MENLAIVRDIKQLNHDTFLMRIESEKIASLAKAGQFVNVKCGNGLDAYLRRPVSIHSLDRESKTFDIVFQIRGKGTGLLAQYGPGDEIDIIGPLGRGFTVDQTHKHIVVAGGGIGIFPLLQLLKDHTAVKKTAILGFRSWSFIVLEEEFRKHCTELITATDDGSYGIRGFVTDVLEERIKEEKPDMVYFCGPTAMMKTGVRLLEKYNIPCEVSMEQRMGCGVGACLVCVCKTRKGNDWDYSRICTDGPVFKGEDIIFD